MRAPHPQRGVSRSVLVAVASGVLVSAAVAALAVVFVIRAGESARRVACLDHLQHLYKGVHLYRTAFGGGAAYPPHTGARFLACATGCADKAHPAGYAASAPLAGRVELLDCPSAGRSKDPIDYRGPQLYVPFGGASPHPSALGPATPGSHPIACDKPGNHEKKAGHVLCFDGTARWAEGEAYGDATDATE